VTAEGRTRIESTPIRAAIARRMVASKREAPHFYVSAEIDMEALLEVVRIHNETRPGDRHATMTAVLIRAAALTLAEHPTFNAVWDGDDVYRVEAINIGVAIALETGLIAPALLDCRERDLDDISAGLADLVERARAGRLRAPEIADATFTLSNLGMFDVASFTAIITPPQVAILATARTVPRAVVRDGEVVVRRTLTATLSADHRVVDGVAAARFLERLKGLVEGPAGWSPSRQ
jgi:pyruvate dehydrogenase E2 component (dihydrolipoamide acetyltransferase)